jgi:hypothetical protein
VRQPAGYRARFSQRGGEISSNTWRNDSAPRLLVPYGREISLRPPTAIPRSPGTAENGPPFSHGGNQCPGTHKRSRSGRQKIGRSFPRCGRKSKILPGSNHDLSSLTGLPSSPQADNSLGPLSFVPTPQGRLIPRVGDTLHPIRVSMPGISGEIEARPQVPCRFRQ